MADRRASLLLSCASAAALACAGPGQATRAEPAPPASPDESSQAPAARMAVTHSEPTEWPPPVPVQAQTVPFITDAERIAADKREQDEATAIFVGGDWVWTGKYIIQVSGSRTINVWTGYDRGRVKALGGFRLYLHVLATDYGTPAARMSIGTRIVDCARKVAEMWPRGTMLPAPNLAPAERDRVLGELADVCAVKPSILQPVRPTGDN